MLLGAALAGTAIENSMLGAAQAGSQMWGGLGNAVGGGLTLAGLYNANPGMFSQSTPWGGGYGGGYPPYPPYGGYGGPGNGDYGGEVMPTWPRS